VLYVSGGFYGRPLSDRQRRFGNCVVSYLSLLQELSGEQDDLLRIGLALHSLRAVPEAAMGELFAAAATRGGRPVHIHIAEQIAEVQECQAIRGARPVQWLLDNAPVDEHWTLVHATHLEASETAAIARSKAVVALCPTTEGNLGDGLFPLREFLDQGGRFGIGSDSNVSVSPVEELRWLEYGQRLVTRQRNIAASKTLPSAGESLVVRAVGGGRQSNGHGEQDEDLLMLDPDSLSLVGAAAADVHDRFVFAGNRNLVKDVFVAGRQVIADGRHARGEMIARRYQHTLRALLADG
jgi:formimidoylglutamate deiminase